MNPEYQTKLKALLFVLAIFATACDPMRRINMRNHSDGEAKVAWLIKEDSIHSSPFFISSAQRQEFVLAANQKKPIRFSAGVGTWTRPYLRNLVDDLDSMVITWNKGEIRLGTQDEILDFLWTRRKGFGRDKIEITIKDP